MDPQPPLADPAFLTRDTHHDALAHRRRFVAFENDDGVGTSRGGGTGPQEEDEDDDASGFGRGWFEAAAAAAGGAPTPGGDPSPHAHAHAGQNGVDVSSAAARGLHAGGDVDAHGVEGDRGEEVADDDDDEEEDGGAYVDDEADGEYEPRAESNGAGGGTKRSSAKGKGKAPAKRARRAATTGGRNGAQAVAQDYGYDATMMSAYDASTSATPYDHSSSHASASGSNGGGGAGAVLEEAAAQDEAEPLYVNAKQYHRILKRRMARARLEEMGRLSRERKVRPARASLRRAPFCSHR